MSVTRQLTVDAETVILLFLTLYCNTSYASPASYSHRTKNTLLVHAHHVRHVDLLHLAQSFFLLDVCTATTHSLTEREVYYRHPRLFLPGRQAAVQRAIRRLCGWLNTVHAWTRGATAHCLRTRRRQRSRSLGRRGRSCESCSRSPSRVHGKTRATPSHTCSHDSLSAPCTTETVGYATEQYKKEGDMLLVQQTDKWDDMKRITVARNRSREKKTMNASIDAESIESVYQPNTAYSIVACMLAALSHPHLFFAPCGLARRMMNCVDSELSSTRTHMCRVSVVTSDATMRAMSTEHRSCARRNYSRESLGLCAAGRSLVTGYLCFGVRLAASTSDDDDGDDYSNSECDREGDVACATRMHVRLSSLTDPDTHTLSPRCNNNRNDTFTSALFGTTDSSTSETMRTPSLSRSSRTPHRPRASTHALSVAHRSCGCVPILPPVAAIVFKMVMMISRHPLY